MPADHTIHPDQKMIFSMAWEILTLEDVIQHRNRLCDDPLFSVHCCQIIDLRRVTSVELSHDEIWAVANRRILAPDSRRAIVISSALQFGLSRVFHAYSEAQLINIFERFHDAAEWAGVPVEAANKAMSELCWKHGLA